MDVAGKVMARIVKERLDHIVKRVLPESQNGFRKGRGCIDMIYVARQLVEKAWEHNDTLYMLFANLRKSYDSVLREALWRVMEKYGVSLKLLSITKSFHKWMQEEVQVGSMTTDLMFRMGSGKDAHWHLLYLTSTLEL